MTAVAAGPVRTMVQRCLDNISKQNARTNAFVALRDPESVKIDADMIDAEPSHGPLGGITLGIKDNYCTLDGLPTTCASEILKGYQSPYEATVVQLLKNAGGIVIGKTNMDEFAMGSNNEYSSFGKVLNPLFNDTEVSAGGSSGGSAAAVAADMCQVALGSDTGGSVRLPSAYCGVIGFKPSYGLISRNGLVSYAQSLDTVGILSKDMDLIKKTFNVLNKYDSKDPTSLRPEIRDQIKQLHASELSPQNGDLVRRPHPLRIGVCQEAIIDLTPEVRDAWESALDYLLSLGHEIRLVSIPSLKSALPLYFTVSLAEASSNLARYDGVRYGARALEDKDPMSGVLYGPTRSKGFGDEVQRRILLGTYNLTAAAYGSHFLKAQKVRRKLQLEFNSIFSAHNILYENGSYEPGSIDVLLQPTARTPAPTFDEVLSEPAISAYTNDVLTVPANHAGLPAISVPWGPKSVGMQILGQFGDDHTVLEVASLLMKK